MSSPPPPASPPSSIASSIMPRSSPSMASPTASKKQRSVPRNADVNAEGPNHDRPTIRSFDRLAAHHQLCHLLDARGSPRSRKLRSLMITADERLAAAAEGEAPGIDEA